MTSSRNPVIRYWIINPVHHFQHPVVADSSVESPKKAKNGKKLGSVESTTGERIYYVLTLLSSKVSVLFGQSFVTIISNYI